MEDETEVLDWGHEDELGVAVHSDDQRLIAAEDAEDAVSLGGDEEDEFLTYQSRVPQDSPPRRSHSPPKPARHPRQSDPQRDVANSPSSQRSQEHPVERTAAPDQPPLPARALVHALPPKPIVSSVPFVHPSHPSIIEATAMASRVDRDKRNGTGSKAAHFDYNESLPPGWELKYSRNNRGVYYYNVHTQESTWTRPTSHSAREKRSERSDLRDDPLDKPLSSRNAPILAPRVGRTDSGDDMSYNDRHYRPGEAARREERTAPPAQLIDSYVPDSCSPNHRNSRPSSPPPRARERDLSPPARRRLTPDESYGDRDDTHPSHREPPAAAPSAQDRFRSSRPPVTHDRPRERRHRDDPTPSDTDRRHLPRDTERSSTTRPRSPASYPRGSQESANTTSHSSAKPPQPVSDGPPGRKSRFSQLDGLVQQSHRQAEPRDVGMRRTRTDDVSHSARYVDDVPSSRSVPDARDDDILIHSASDAQRSVSRKRTPLPPQDAAYRPGARTAPAQRGAVYPLGSVGPASVAMPEMRRTTVDDVSHDPARYSPSPPPQHDSAPSERGDRDRGRSRWSNPYSNGPSRTTHESSRGRVHDVAMDIDDAPPPRLSDPPTKQAPPRRPALQDDVPRFPRAMLNADNDGPSRGARDVRDGESRHRDGSSRFVPPRDRPGTERHSTDQSSSQKELSHNVETRLPPSGSNVKLSGTNNIPVGSRNKFAANAVPPPVSPSNARRAPPVISGSNGEPIAPRRDRVSKEYERAPPLDLDASTSDQGVPFEPTRREDVRRPPLSSSRALPVAEPPLPTRLSRAGRSRFGPPIIRDDPEPVQASMNVSSESLPSEQIPEGSSHATPPPPSRESSMASIKDTVTLPSRPAHLPPRPVSPPGGYRYRDDNKPYSRPNARNTSAHDFRANDAVFEGPARPARPSSPTWKNSADARSYDAPPAPRNDRDTYSPERSRANKRDTEVPHLVVTQPQPPPPPLPPVVPEESHERLPAPTIHPERILMLQANGLPPRPLSSLGPNRSGKGMKRDRREDYDRAEPLRGKRRASFGSASPAGERHRYPEDDRSVSFIGMGGGGSGISAGGGSGGGGSGASLLDRLSSVADDTGRIDSPSLRERVQLPSKRDREEMMANEFSIEVQGDGYEYQYDYDVKRARRRGGAKTRKGRFQDAW